MHPIDKLLEKRRSGPIEHDALLRTKYHQYRRYRMSHGWNCLSYDDWVQQRVRDYIAASLRKLNNGPQPMATVLEHGEVEFEYARSSRWATDRLFSAFGVPKVIVNDAPLTAMALAGTLPVEATEI